jgi:hypothetical protein
MLYVFENSMGVSFVIPTLPPPPTPTTTTTPLPLQKSEMDESQDWEIVGSDPDNPLIWLFFVYHSFESFIAWKQN